MITRPRPTPTALILAAVFVVMNCAAHQVPWDVSKGDEARFAEVSRVCRLLTDDTEGELVPERFDRCMERRGWKRQCFVKRLFRRD